MGSLGDQLQVVHGVKVAKMVPCHQNALPSLSLYKHFRPHQYNSHMDSFIFFSVHLIKHIYMYIYVLTKKILLYPFSAYFFFPFGVHIQTFSYRPTYIYGMLFGQLV